MDKQSVPVTASEALNWPNAGSHELPQLIGYRPGQLPSGQIRFGAVHTYLVSDAQDDLLGSGS